VNTHPTHKIPMSTFKALKDWELKGVPLHGFLRAIVENDLMNVVCRTYKTPEQERLREICDFVCVEMPQRCWGSRNKVREWARSKQYELWEHK